MKDEADKEFKKIEGQVQNHIMFVTTGEEELLVLQTTFGTQKVQGLCFENIPTKDVIGSTLVELESLQQKVDFQISSINKHSNYC